MVSRRSRRFAARVIAGPDALVMLISMLAALGLASSDALLGAEVPLRIGFVDPAVPGPAVARNAEALEFAATQGQAARIRPAKAGGWLDAEKRLAAPEEFDVVWFHQADDPAAAMLPEAAVGDLYEYVELGGVLLVSGAAWSRKTTKPANSRPVSTLAEGRAARLSAALGLALRGRPRAAGGRPSRRPGAFRSRVSPVLAADLWCFDLAKVSAQRLTSSAE